MHNTHRTAPSCRRSLCRKFAVSVQRTLAGLLLILPATLATATEPVPLTAHDIVEKAHEAAGGETWRTLRTLQLQGHASFFNAGQTSVADSYRMIRVLPDHSASAHLANGMVRFDAYIGEKVLFQISFDGKDSYDQNGLIEDAAASERWKSNFGFGIIRFALEPGFVLTRMADDTVDGHESYFIRVTDPSGQDTLFAIDRESYAIRMVGFDTPRGFHHRIYDTFRRREGLSFTQPGHVRLYYDSVKTADIRWTDFRVNEDLSPERFVISPTP